jgi:hypothetical protein
VEKVDRKNKVDETEMKDGRQPQDGQTLRVIGMSGQLQTVVHIEA